MCGIMAYKGKRKCLPIILDGLKKLEYRGYDSAGVSYIIENKLITYKSPGCVNELINNWIDFEMPTYIGIGHTRWATHGQPSQRNAHPHATADERISIVHNGIIENYFALQKELIEKGYMFVSETDTEVLLYLIYDYILNEKCSLFTAVKLALERVVGAYAICVLDRKSPDTMVVARKGSPLVIGKGVESEFYVASDPLAIVSYTNDIIFIEDSCVVEITDQLQCYNMKIQTVSECNVSKLYNQIYNIEKDGFDNFMMKEIFEQPRVVADCLSGRIDGYRIKLGGLIGYENILSNTDHITILSCGSSWHAGLIAKYYFEELCRIKTTVEYASEFRYRKPVIKEDDIVICISQSGETADTISAIELAKSKGAIVVGVCNVVDSSLARLTDCGVYCRAGAEIGVASTKAFTAQVLVMLLIALWIEQYQNEHILTEYRQIIIDDLRYLSIILEETLKLDRDIRKLAVKFYKSKNCLYLGREYNFPIALEGALKLKEISYIHAEGYPAAEMKHGPIALIDKNMPVIVVSNNKKQYTKIVNNIKEIQARKGKVIEVYSEDRFSGDFGLKVPYVVDPVSPLVSNVALQLFAYYCAVLRGHNVDKPRNLAKSVTVE
jgi:glucosamine--fructose-6-phosphate aminotransferase (isomerizing)